MKSAIYFPILRAKRGEISAIGHLSAEARTRIRPTLDIPKPKAKNKDPNAVEYPSTRRIKMGERELTN